jgi:asparagine synthase (glutamine-hydrolysing)
MNELYEHEILPCDTHGCFIDDSGRMSSIPNSLADSNSQVNDEAVFSVLQFGAIIPPLSPWTRIRRLMPGYKYHGGEIVGPVELRQQTHISNLDSEQQADEIENILDHILQKQIGARDPVLLFSGGVDSGIIASRLAALGYSNSLLINYSFGDEDPESKLAEAMANLLGLKYERVSANRQQLCSCLLCPGQIYPQPFGDHSTVPTSDLANAVVKRLSGQKRIILDGTGADGAVGMTKKIDMWERLIRVPAILRKAASFAYGNMLWYREGKIEYFPRIFRRSIDMPLLSAVLAQNPLAGIFYSKRSGNSVYSLLDKWIGGWAGELPSKRIIAADLALTCANIFAQKAQPILESAGHKVLYPFLDVDMVTTALNSVPYWQMDEAKAPLKKSLARHVPRDMVYRPKSGFIDPRVEVFFSEEFISYLCAAAEPTTPIANLLKRKPLLKACQLLARKRTLPAQTLSILWAIVFTDRWYRTVFS